MRIFSIETTTKFGSLAIIEDEKIIKEVLWASKNVSEEIMCYIETLLEDYPYKINEFDYVVVSLGPGSWTGIRLGISLVKGLCIGEREKIYCVYMPESFFYILQNSKYQICCLINASGENFYYSFYKENNFRNCFTKPPEIFYSPLNKIIDMIKEKTILVGPGLFEINKDVFSNPLLIPSPPYMWYPKASVNGLLSFYKIKEKISSPIPEQYYGK